MKNENKLTYRLFPVVFSVYSGILFGDICAPGDHAKSSQSWQLLHPAVPCSRHQASATKLGLVTVCWFLLTIRLCTWLCRILINFAINPKRFLSSASSYRFGIISTV